MEGVSITTKVVALSSIGQRCLIGLANLEMTERNRRSLDDS